jgi:hypothetical protein
MTILRNVTFYWAKLKVPNAMFDKANPRWEVQLRTTDKAQLAEWRELGLNPRLAEDEENGGTFYRVNLQRRSKHIKTGENVDPPTVVSAANKPIDSGSVGNGSIGHIRLWFYDTTSPDGAPIKGVTFTGIQLTTHVKFAMKAFEDFNDEGETTVIEAEEVSDESEEEFEEETPAPKVAPRLVASRPVPPATSGKPKPPATKKTDKDPLY